MVNKRFWLGMLAMALVFGMTVVGCDKGDTDKGGGTTGGKSITITGITGKTGVVSIMVLSNFSYDGPVAGGMGSISGNSVTFSLVKDEAFNPWTGSGSYYLYLTFEKDDIAFFYTNGQTFAQLGITSDADMAKLPKYNISSATSTIAFNKFAKDEEPASPTPTPGGVNLTQWTPAYLQVKSTGYPNKDNNRFHFHIGNVSTSGYVEIQKILVNSTKSLTEAEVVIDFTMSSGGKPGLPYMANKDYNYDYDFSSGGSVAVIRDGGTSNGRVVMSSGNNVYKYQGTFASGAAWNKWETTGSAYWIFIIKSNGQAKTSLGDARMAYHTGASETADGETRFADLEF